MHKLPYKVHKLVVLVDESKHNKLKKRLRVLKDCTVSDRVRQFVDEELEQLSPLPNESN